MTSGGQITNLAFYIYTTAATPLQNYRIMLANVTNTSLTGTILCPTYDTVYLNASFTVPSTVGWYTFTFNHGTPFFWSGGSVLVDVSHMQCSSCPSSPCVNYTYPNSNVQYTTTSSTLCQYVFNDNDCSVNTCTPSSYVYTTTQRPSMQFGILVPPSLNWLNVTKLYKNAALTTPVALTDTIRTVYAAPSTTTAYRAVANLQGCLSDPSDYDTVFVNPIPDVTITPAGSNTICNGNSVTFCVPSGASQTFQWYKGTTAIAGATGNCYAATIAGSYKVTATNVVTVVLLLLR